MTHWFVLFLGSSGLIVRCGAYQKNIVLSVIVSINQYIYVHCEMLFDS